MPAEALPSPEQTRGRHLRHGICGSGGVDAASVDAGRLTDREDARIRCRAVIVDDHSSLRVHVESGIAREFVPRSHADGEDDEVGALEGTVLELERRDGSRVVRIEPRRPGSSADSDAPFFEGAAQDVCCSFVQQRGKETIRVLHDRRADSGVVERCSGLDSVLPATDDDASQRTAESTRSRIDEIPHRLRVLDGAQDEAAGEASP